MSRIAIAGFQHETNSFTAHRADYAHFCQHRDRPPLVKGRALVESLAGGSYATSGLLAQAGTDWDVVPLLWTSGGAGGPVTADAFERIVGELVTLLAQAGPVDGVYLDLHGAVVCEAFDDGDGEILRRVRAVVGEGVPVVASLDYHANISQQMLRMADALVVCKTYPHVDRPETGARAARILEDLMRHGRPRGRALRRTPFLLPIEFQCTLVEPSRSITAWAPPPQQGPAQFSYAAGFPASDTRECGPAVVVYACGQAQADAIADAYLAYVLERESAFSAQYLELDEGAREAVRLAQSARRPIIVSDTCDNPGAGGSGDTTGILHALRGQHAQDVLAGYFFDPEAARRAAAAGPDARVFLQLGAGSRTPGQTPFSGEFTVLRCTDQPFPYTGPVAGNVMADLGQMVLVELEGIQVAITSRLAQAYDAAPFLRLGADPSRARILVLKSSCHFRAEFEPMAEGVLTVLAPGNYQPDPLKYPYRLLPREGIRLPAKGRTPA